MIDRRENLVHEKYAFPQKFAENGLKPLHSCFFSVPMTVPRKRLIRKKIILSSSLRECVSYLLGSE